MKKRMTANFQGRVNNYKLIKSDAMLPLFEALVNSIQAIEDRRKNGEIFDGRITVTGIRLPTLECKPEELPPGRITDFIIEDKGIGFNDENFTSFLECDSQYKVERGGKGVGRFCWLMFIYDQFRAYVALFYAIDSLYEIDPSDTNALCAGELDPFLFKTLGSADPARYVEFCSEYARRFGESKATPYDCFSFAQEFVASLSDEFHDLWKRFHKSCKTCYHDACKHNGRRATC